VTLFAPIVEGHGDVRAVPILLRRVAAELYAVQGLQVLPAHRVPRGRMFAADSAELKKAIELAARRIRGAGSAGGVLVLLDADDDCPAREAPMLLARIRRSDVPVRVVMATREYEAWFLAAAESLRAHRGVVASAMAPPDPESIRDAKGHLAGAILKPGAFYQETVDQPALTATLGIEQARRAPSFDKLCRDVRSLLLGAAA